MSEVCPHSVKCVAAWKIIGWAYGWRFESSIFEEGFCSLGKAAVFDLALYFRVENCDGVRPDGSRFDSSVCSYVGGLVRFYPGVMGFPGRSMHKEFYPLGAFVE